MRSKLTGDFKLIHILLSSFSIEGSLGGVDARMNKIMADTMKLYPIPWKITPAITYDVTSLIA